MKRVLEAVSCPDKLSLAFCLFEGNRKDQSTVPFRVQEKDSQGSVNNWTEYIKVDSIEREDAGGNNFNIRGYNIANSSSVVIHISIVRRYGTMTFV